MINDKAKRICVLLLIVAVAIACCTVGRLLVRAVVPTVWTVTQFASTQGNQIMSYTIEDNKDHFAIVDGGFGVDAEIVWKKIQKHKHHVDAWIVTHPHPDHTGAFNYLMLNLSEAFTVDTIYLPEVNAEVYEEKNKPYDGIESFYEQTEVIKSLDNVVYLHENDCFDLIGLDAKVLSSWDANVDALPDHLPNNGSVMFRVDGNEQSMLFCADVQEEMESYIIPAHKDELKADYVQCGHHGNWGLTKEFYDYVDASVAFMDAPDWIFDPGSNYTAAELREYLQDRGVTVYSFTTAPNQVKIR